MTDHDIIARRYLATSNEADPAQRRALIAGLWVEECHYVDPMMQGEGQDGIAAMIEAARAQFPGLGFTLAGKPDGHGDHLRFSWTLAPEGGVAIAAGTDICRLDAGRRLISVVGFLDGSAVDA